jgi:hypothetical protein
MAKKPGQFQPAGTIVIHPFGRYCNGWKSAGETDVFESRDDAMKRFNIDTNRVALAGFSMGGAGRGIWARIMPTSGPACTPGRICRCETLPEAHAGQISRVV